MEGERPVEIPKQPTLEEQLATKSREELAAMLAEQDKAIADLDKTNEANPPTESGYSQAIQLREAREKIQAALDKLPQ